MQPGRLSIFNPAPFPTPISVCPDLLASSRSLLSCQIAGAHKQLRSYVALQQKLKPMGIA